jgi:hypothetical protein
VAAFFVTEKLLITKSSDIFVTEISILLDKAAEILL